MANYATNLFFANTENERDLDKIEAFLDDKFGVCYQDRNDDCWKSHVHLPPEGKVVLTP